ALTTVSELQGMPQLLDVDLFGNDGIYCLELDALEAGLPQTSINRPQTCASKPLTAISFVDNQLRDCVLSTGPNYVEDMTNLVCNNLGITELSGIEMLPYLEFLDLRDNALTTLSALQGLSALMDINLDGNDAIYCLDLDALEAALPNATVLRPQSCASKPLTAISFADQQLDSCVQNSGSQYVEEVFSLSCDGWSISQLGGIDELVELESLDLAYSDLTIVSELQGMSNLIDINLYGNDGIYCLELDALEVALPEAGITRPLSCAFKPLTVISFADLQLHNCVQNSGSQYVEDLLGLSCGGENITQLGGIEELERLEFLYLHDNALTTVSELQGMPQLLDVDLFGNDGI
ncbi:hypothetical protein LCGC14_3079700, partial [marine sediment metagenome]